MKISNYNEFLNENNRETDFYLSHRICYILDMIKRSTQDIKIIEMVDVILGLSNNSRDNITYVDITDKNDMVSFFDLNKLFQVYYENEKLTGDRNFQKISDETFDNFLNWIPGIYDSEFNQEDNWIWKDKRRTSINVGRLFNRLLNKAKFSSTPKELEDLGNLYKSSYDILHGEKSLKLVSGEEIKKWYLEDNYLLPGGDLNNSCMRYQKCQDFFNIYIKNPDKVSLLILQKNDNLEKIIGRALVWKLNDGRTYMDRIYTCIYSDDNLFKKYAQENNILTYHQSDLEVTLKEYDFGKYPYMDTFSYLDMNDGTLYSDFGGGSNVRQLQSTTGGWDRPDDEDCVYSERYGEDIPRDDACWCEDIDDYLYSDDCYWLDYKGIYVSNRATVYYSDYFGSYILEDDAVHSEHMNDWLFDDEVVPFYPKSDSEIEDYVPKNIGTHINDFTIVEDEISGKDTLIILCYKINDKYYFKDWNLTLVSNEFDGIKVNYNGSEWTILESTSYQDQNSINLDKMDHLTISIKEYIKTLMSTKITLDDYISNILETVSELSKLRQRFYKMTNIYPISSNIDILSLMAYILIDPSKIKSKTLEELFSNKELINKINTINKEKSLENSIFNIEIDKQYYGSYQKNNLLEFIKIVDKYYTSFFLKTPEMIDFYQQLKQKSEINERYRYYPQ